MNAVLHRQGAELEDALAERSDGADQRGEQRHGDGGVFLQDRAEGFRRNRADHHVGERDDVGRARRAVDGGVLAEAFAGVDVAEGHRSEEHTSELQSLMRISYAVFCLQKKKDNSTMQTHTLMLEHMMQTAIR